MPQVQLNIKDAPTLGAYWTLLRDMCSCLPSWN